MSFATKRKNADADLSGSSPKRPTTEEDDAGELEFRSPSEDLTPLIMHRIQKIEKEQKHMAAQIEELKAENINKECRIRRQGNNSREVNFLLKGLLFHPDEKPQDRTFSPVTRARTVAVIKELIKRSKQTPPVEEWEKFISICHRTGKSGKNGRPMDVILKFCHVDMTRFVLLHSKVISDVAFDQTKIDGISIIGSTAKSQKLLLVPNKEKETERERKMIEFIQRSLTSSTAKLAKTFKKNTKPEEMDFEKEVLLLINSRDDFPKLVVAYSADKTTRLAYTADEIPEELWDDVRKSVLKEKEHVKLHFNKLIKEYKIKHQQPITVAPEVSNNPTASTS